jgi:hypothetical protein
MIALIGITIERNVTSSSRNASPSTKAKISGSLLLSWSGEVLRAGRVAADVDGRARDPADRRRDDLVAQHVEGVHGRASLPLPGVGTLICATVPSLL